MFCLGSRSAPARPRRLAAATVCALLLSACAPGGGGDAAPREPERSPTPAASTTAAAELTPEQRLQQRAERIVGRMTLAQKAGQVMVTTWSGGTPPVDQVRRLHLGGVIALPGSGTMSPGEAKAGNRALAGLFSRRGYPAFLGVDQEGGVVSRIGEPATRFPAFMAAGAADRRELTRAVERALGAELRGLGFTVVFSPSADVTIGGADPAIGSRSAGSDPRRVARHVVEAVAGLEEAGMVPVVKHFPGHGSVTTDSHLATPVQRRPWRQVDRIDLYPFKRAIARRVPAVMTSHIRVPAVDPRQPTTTSHRMTTGVLRERLGFDGLVVTDALNMRGIVDRHPGPAASLRALEAGADVLLMPPDPRASRDLIVRSVLTGRLSITRLDDAATRMVRALLAARTSRGAPLGSGRDVAARLVQEALTVVAGRCTGDRLPDVVRVSGNPGAVARFSAAARAAGTRIQTAPPRRPLVRKVVTRTVRVRVMRNGRPVVVKREVRRVVRVRGPRPAPAPLVALLGYGAPVPDAATIAIATERPTTLARISAPTELATYADTTAAMNAAVRTLTGQAPAPGRLTTPVDGSRPGCS